MCGRRSLERLSGELALHPCVLLRPDLALPGLAGDLFPKSEPQAAAVVVCSGRPDGCWLAGAGAAGSSFLQSRTATRPLARRPLELSSEQAPCGSRSWPHFLVTGLQKLRRVLCLRYPVEY